MPKIVIRLDTSQMMAFRNCPRYWYYSYREHLRSPYAKQRAADKGTLVHLMLQIFYTLKTAQPDVNPIEHSTNTVEIFKKLRIEKDFDKLYNLEDKVFLHIIERFTQYAMRHYRNDMRILENNGVPALEIGFSKVLYEDADVIFIVEGRLDYLCEYNGIEMWGDHKTQDQSRILYPYKSQFLTYAWATGFDRALINYFGMQAKFDEKDANKIFHRQAIYFPQWRIEAWENEMKSIFWEAKNFLDASKALEELGENAFPMKTNSCGGNMDYFPCIFSKICETESPELKAAIKQNYFAKRIPWETWSLESNEEALV